jgi:spermidine synthase
LLYSANIAGAVVGCLVAGFYLLRVHDMAVATYTAALINVAVALLSLLLARAARPGLQPSPAPSSRVRAPGAVFVYLAIALSGLTALGAEVVWTRLLSLLIGATVYTFSIILAVFLAGLWAGSVAGSFVARRVREPRLALAACQMLLAFAIAGTAYTLAYLLPYWPVDPWLSTNPLFNFDLDVARCVRTIFPATLLWGASFPLALAGAAAEREDPGKLFGEVYAVNTAGSITGALGFSLVLIPGIGTRGSQQLLIWLSVAGAALAIAPVALTMRPRMRPVRLWTSTAFAALAGGVVVAWVLASTVASVPWQAIAYGRRVAPLLRGLDLSAEARPLFVGEGINASVVITDRGGQRMFYVSGKSEASSALLDMRLQRMMGHIPALIHPRPRAVLVVGFGAGVTAGSFVPYPEVQRIVICELERMIPPASNEFFGAQNYNVLHNRRAHVVYDDARHFIFTTLEKFDVITTDPIHPWVKGTSTLYSKEYFELVRQHLNPGGVAAQWLPVYESDEETVKTQLATFFEVFPNGTVWSNYLNGDGYDLVLLGRTDASPLNVDELQHRLDEAAYSGVSASLAEAEFNSAVDLLATYAGRASDLAPMLAKAQINRDLNMRLQYLAGWGLNSVTAPQVYRKVLSYRRFPEDLLTGTGERLEALREVLDRPHRTF